jgi:tRNA modification GTPase
VESGIFALASGPGRAGIQVIRASGRGVAQAVAALAGGLPPPRQAALRAFAHAGVTLDQGLVMWFPAPASFTGEDVAEFHLHGGRAVRDGFFAALAALGLQPAEPGAFSRRAVENGKLDLTRAEAIADLVDAQTPAQLAQALRQYDGALADLYDGWRAALIAALGRAEAAIDFSDDGVGDEQFAAARAQAMEIYQQIQQHMDDAGRGEMLRDGLRLALVGPPNAGKSSLLNVLARRDVAIVSETPGTTRDVVEVALNLGGYPVHVADTAGLRETKDAIEAEGVRRALDRARDSDLVLLLLDGAAPHPPTDVRADLVVWNKSELPGFVSGDGLAVSLKTGAGVTALLDRLTQLVRDKLDAKSDAPVLTRPRHRAALEDALAALEQAQAARPPELLAEDLRLAARAIGRITGQVDVEEVLDFVFRDFCIGK